MKPDKVFCVNLDRREDRWAAFQSRDWPWPVERFSAVDGHLCPPPRWFTTGGGAWGCLQSHLRLYERILQSDWNRVLILEDDAEPLKGWASKIPLVWEDLPPSWEMLYLGGQHLQRDSKPPARITNNLVRVFNCQRTHAYMVNRKGALNIYKRLTSQLPHWERAHHIDWYLGKWHPEMQAYASYPFVIGQSLSPSDIATGRKPKAYTWNDEVAPVSWKIVAVTGEDRAGVYAVRDALKHLKVRFSTAKDNPDLEDPQELLTYACNRKGGQGARVGIMCQPEDRAKIVNSFGACKGIHVGTSPEHNTNVLVIPPDDLRARPEHYLVAIIEHLSIIVQDGRARLALSELEALE